MNTTEQSTVYIASATPSAIPSSPGEWSLQQIQDALKRPLPKSMLSTRKQGTQLIEYLPWHKVVSILDKYCVGWQWEIKAIHTTSDRIFLTGRLTVPTSDGLVYREAVGTEELQTTNWGDPSSNASAMALRRAAALFGLALGMYEK